MSKDTYAQRDFTNGDVQHRKGDDLKDLPPNQLADFQAHGLAGPKPADTDKPTTATKPAT